MIQQQTLLKIADNSGAITAKCIKILGGLKKKYAYQGECIIVSIQKLSNKFKKTKTYKVKKKEIYKALIIKTKTKIWKKTGYAKIFSNNSIVLINKQNNPIATRILSFVPANLKKKKLQKIVSLSFGLI